MERVALSTMANRGLVTLYPAPPLDQYLRRGQSSVGPQMLSPDLRTKMRYQGLGPGVGRGLGEGTPRGVGVGLGVDVGVALGVVVAVAVGVAVGVAVAVAVGVGVAPPVGDTRTK